MEPKKEKPEQQFQSVGYVAALIDKCPRTVYRAIRSGRITAVRFGASVMISRREVERIVAKGF